MLLRTVPRTGTAERRASPRHSCSLPIRYHVVGLRARDPSQGLTSDLSRDGAGLILPAALAEGTCLRLEIGGPRGVCRSAVVRHCAPARPDRWLVGCSFSVALSEAELHRLLGK